VSGAHPLDSEFAGRSGAALLGELTAIASRAAAAILAIRDAGTTARLKADASPVTEADEAAEAVIFEGLGRLLPGIPAVAEEAVARSVCPALGRGFILVDPLDGTKEFLDGQDEFTVNLALIAEAAPVVGIIAAPALGRIWRGVSGRGGERLDLAPGAEPASARAVVPLRPRRAPARLVVTVSRSHLDRRTEAFVAALPSAERLTSGSSLKFCRLAEGSADVYPRLGPTREWDVAAGHAILAASGGTMTAPDGGAVTYGRVADGFLVPGFLAWADPAAAQKFRAPGF
jgi:3'(2'), 5'-bisphosphate nucleotidase